jgi:hypothetical protein
LANPAVQLLDTPELFSCSSGNNFHDEPPDRFRPLFRMF